MFDVSARPCVPEGVLSFSVPMVKFMKMIGYMDESFLITDSWKKVQKEFYDHLRKICAYPLDLREIILFFPQITQIHADI